MKKATFVSFSILINCFFLIEARSQTWVTTYYYENSFGSTMHHDSIGVGPWEMQRLNDSTIYILNFPTQNGFRELMKINSAGNLDWLNNVAIHGGIVLQMAWGVKVTQDGGCVYVFYDYSTGFNDYCKMFRLNSDGTTRWTLNYNFPKMIESVLPTFYNTYIVKFDSTTQNADSLSEFDSSGHFMRSWYNFYGGVAAMPDSDLIVTDSFTVTRQSFNGTIEWTLTEGFYMPIFADSSYIFLINKDYANNFILKVNAVTGSLIWKKSFNRNSVSVTSDYGLILSNGNSVEKYDSTGNLQWAKSFQLPAFGVKGVIEISSGKYLLGGAYRCMGRPYSAGNTGYSSFFATLDSSGNGVIDSTDSFFAGNANDNNTLSFADDAAYMGVAMNASGTARSSPLIGGVGNAWSVFAEDWSQAFPNGVNYKYSDADGNGIIDINDVIQINSFYYWPFYVPSHWKLSTNNAVPELKVIADKDTVIPGDTITVKIVLGSSSSPIDSIYSLSLSLWSAMYFIDTPPLVNITAVQFGDTTTNLMSYYTQNYQTGNVNIMLYRNDHQNAYINGDTLAIIKMYVMANPYPGNIHFGCTATALTERGYSVALNFVADSAFVLNTTSINETNSYPITIFPNPAHDKIFLQTINDLEKEFKIIDTSGRIVKSGSAGKEINIAGLDNGVYYIEVISNDKKYHQRIIKQ